MKMIAVSFALMLSACALHAIETEVMNKLGWVMDREDDDQFDKNELMGWCAKPENAAWLAQLKRNPKDSYAALHFMCKERCAPQTAQTLVIEYGLPIDDEIRWDILTSQSLGRQHAQCAIARGSCTATDFESTFLDRLHAISEGRYHVHNDLIKRASTNLAEICTQRSEGFIKAVIAYRDVVPESALAVLIKDSHG